MKVPVLKVQLKSHLEHVAGPDLPLMEHSSEQQGGGCSYSGICP